MPFVSDTFTGTNGTLLTAHSSDVGGTWVVNTSQSGSAQIQSNKAYQSAAVQLHMLSTATPPSADYSVAATLSLSASGALTMQGAVLGRFSTSALSGYRVRVVSSSGSRNLDRIDAGSVTTLQSVAGTLPVTAGIEIDNTSKRMTAGGSVVASSTDNTYTAAGSVGFMLRSVSGSNFYYLDDFIATDLAAPAGRTFWSFSQVLE